MAIFAAPDGRFHGESVSTQTKPARIPHHEESSTSKKGTKEVKRRKENGSKMLPASIKEKEAHWPEVLRVSFTKGIDT